MELLSAGLRVTDTTCPLVRKAHDALASLVASGYCPIIIGQAAHAEVLGLLGDFPLSMVILDESELNTIPAHPRYGVVSQTTQPLMKVLALVDSLKRQYPNSEVRFIDTICHPTKQRQKSLEQLCLECDAVVIVGGYNSNNTRQLLETATRLGVKACQIESADELDPGWFQDIHNVGVTGGTSTLDSTLQAVVARLGDIASKKPSGDLTNA
jgi:4-hydroxy-3-methylbut-2-enyl diphosphate reductase